MFESYETFEAQIEGMCLQLHAIPNPKIAFWARTTPEVVVLFFALWKLGKIACPLNPRLPSAEEALRRLGATLFTPSPPESFTPKSWDWEEKNLATLLFTSGSTGTPKIACHTIGNHLYNAKGSLVPLTSEDRWHLSLPLFHVGGIAILFRCYLAKAFLDFSSSYETATHLSLVPTQLLRLLNNFPSLPKLKYILLGGAPLPSTTNLPWKVIPTYGLTEMSSQVVTGNMVHPFAEVKLAEDGEILVRGKTLFQGYYNDQQKLELPIDAEGWFATKDLGRWAGEGKFEIVGRKDNLFISGGENIQPEEVEAAVQQTLGLSEAIVVPLKDREYGERPAVFLKEPCSMQTLQEALKPFLPKYKIPIRIFPLPEDIGYKPNRKALKALAEALASTQEQESLSLPL